MGKFPSDQSYSSSEHFAGAFGGLANVWTPADVSLTRPNNSTAYANNGLIGSSSAVLFKWSSFFRCPGSSGLLTGMRLVASVASIATTNMGAISAHLFNAVPAAALGPNNFASAVDQGTFNFMAADNGAKKLGVVTFATWNGGGAGSDATDSYGTPLLCPQPIIADPLATDLYCLLVATGAFTPIANAIITPYVAAVLD